MSQITQEKPAPLMLALLAVAVITAAWLRFNNLGGWAMWLDEAYSTFGAEQDYRFIWQVLPTYETHPPFYTTVLHSWVLLFGSSTVSVRLFGALIGFVSLFAIWKSARAMADFAERPGFAIGVVAVLLAAMLQTFVDISRLVRPYSLIILVYAIGIWVVFRIAKRHRDERHLGGLHWWVYIGCQGLLFWLHNMGALYVAALGLGFLILAGPADMIRQHWKRFLIGHLVAALIGLPALLILLDQAPTWVQTTWLRFNPAFLPTRLMLLYGMPGAIGVVLCLLLVVLGWRGLGNRRSRIVGALAVMAVLPPLLSMILSMTVAPVFLERTLVAVCVPFVLLMAAAAGQGRISIVALALVLALSLQRVVILQGLPPGEDWGEVARWLAPRVKPGDRIVTYPNEGALPLQYALRDAGKPMPIRALPSWVPARDKAGWYPTGSRGVQSLSEARLREFAQDQDSRVANTIWLVRIQRGLYDQGNVALKVFREGRREVGHFTQNTTEITGLSGRALPPPQP